MKNYTFTYWYSGNAISTGTFQASTKKEAKKYAIRHKRTVAAEYGFPSNRIKIF